MKRILILVFSLIMVFSLVACGTGNDKTADDKTSGGQAGNGGNVVDKTSGGQEDGGENAGGDDSELTIFGTWVHKKTDAEPFPMTITIKEDGTVEWVDTGDKMVWNDNGDGTIEIASPDSVGYGEKAYLTADGKLVWETSIKFGETSLDQVTLERQ